MNQLFNGFQIIVTAFLLSIIVPSIQANAQVNYLFSASSKPYIPVTGGISPHLVSDYPGVWEVEDEGFATIPIGFTFNYNGENYSEANVDVNGFITLGGTLDVFYNYPYFKNRLANAPPYNKRPVIAAFWDDLLLLDTLDLVYKTTGNAPFRVFTIEWKQAKWVYESPDPVLSIELKLFETTNIIEFHYKDEGGLPDPLYAFASIGITSAYANRDFISLQSTSSNPAISLLRANDSLAVKPADNQMYKFTPASLNIPGPLENSLKYTNNKVSFHLQSGGFNNYEYAITDSYLPPASGTQTNSQNVTVSSLLPATTYYIYARSSLLNFIYSQWTCDKFTTAVNPKTLPYKQHFENVTEPLYFPTNMRQQDFSDTSFWYDPSLGYSAFPFLPDAGNSLFYFQIDFFDANVWAFTPGIKLTAGKTYKLKFSYASFWEYDPSDPAALEIKYGKASGAAGMTSGLLFSKNDITNFDALHDTTISFSPSSSGIYYFGFHDISLFLKSALLFDNISLKEQDLEKSFVLDGKTSNTDNLLNWKISDEEAIYSFEMERSADGINFTKIGEVNSKVNTDNSEDKIQPIIRIHRNTEVYCDANKNDKHSKVFIETKPGVEIQRSEDGINFSKTIVADSKSNDASCNGKTDFDYTDHHPITGTNYYRLKQVNKNSSTTYSNVVILERNIGKQLLVSAIYPDPAKDLITVKIESGNAGETILIVTDASGKTFIKNAIQLSMGLNDVQLVVSTLAAGIYFLKIVCEDGCESEMKKFVKQ